MIKAGDWVCPVFGEGYFPENFRERFVRSRYLVECRRGKLFVHDDWGGNWLVPASDIRPWFEVISSDPQAPDQAAPSTAETLHALLQSLTLEQVRLLVELFEASP